MSRLVGLVLVTSAWPSTGSATASTARSRACGSHQRPRYGYYVDHIVDAFGALFLFGGLALSGYMQPVRRASVCSIAYFMLSIEVYLAAHSARHVQDHALQDRPDRAADSPGDRQPRRCSSTRTRRSSADLPAVRRRRRRLAIAGLIVTLVVSAIRNTRELYRAEPIPGRMTR